MGLNKVYEPQNFENSIYELWIEKNAFKPADQGNGYFSIVMPPPNANANLHLGQALTFGAIEDVLARYHRMAGKRVMLVPGADHAGFETQVVYEKHLAKEGKSRFDFSREQLYKQIWDFVELNKDNIKNIYKQLGISCDWNLFTFTLDKKVINTAYKVFKKMWDDGLVYRGERLVNYCTFHGTSFSDIEVEYQEKNGKIYHINYPTVDGKSSITVATTRPETLLGDVAVAINPTDERYKDFVGKSLKLPLTDREIPILQDDMVEVEFGTGCVKITPAHDQNDYELGLRHDLPMITVIGHDGKMNHNCPARYIGMSVVEAREAVLADLKDQGLLVEEVDHTNNIGVCYRCKNIIEPLLSEQWFISMKKLAEPIVASLESNEVVFYPDQKRKQAIEYLKNIRDWNISRQIAWGIPIPAFQNVDDSQEWIFDERVDQEILEINGKTYRRDNDVFDTWFSSGQWPYVTLGFDSEQGTDEYNSFYPITVMETGGEILYPWVCRMLILGKYVTGKLPFEKVYIHGNILAEDGTKMSKSLGNVINPADVLADYGSDALRIGLLMGRVAGVHSAYNSDKVKSGRNFCNKLWNISRFVLDLTEDESSKPEQITNNIVDEWILKKLAECQNNSAKYFENYDISAAYDSVYKFVWTEFADWYIEASKTSPNKSLLKFLLEQILILVHPFAPFVSEAIWQQLPWQSDTLLIGQRREEIAPIKSNSNLDFDEIISLVEKIRYFSKELNVSKPILLVQNESPVKECHDIVIKLAKLGNIEYSSATTGVEIFGLKLKAWLNVDQTVISEYIDKLQKQLDEANNNITQLKSRLNNENYIAKAPTQLVEQTKTDLTHNQDLASQIQATLTNLKS